MDELSLRTGIKRAEGPSLVGRLGVLLFDESSDEILGITAGQVVRGQAPILANGYRIGVCSHDIDRRHDGESRRPAWSLLEMVKLDKDVLIARPSTVLGGQAGPDTLRMTDDVWAHLGAPVLLLNGAPEPREGLLRSVHALFRMRAPASEEAVVFMDAMMITSLDGNPLSQEGDAGTLVTSVQGECLGVIVAGLADTSFAAPIPPLLIDRALRPIDDDDVREWNKRAWTRRLLPSPPPPIAAPAQPVEEIDIDMANDDWLEDPSAMADAGRKLAIAGLGW